MSDISELDEEHKLLLDRWNRYKDTRKTISHETVVKWLETWGAENEIQYPTSPNL